MRVGGGWFKLWRAGMEGGRSTVKDEGCERQGVAGGVLSNAGVAVMSSLSRGRGSNPSDSSNTPLCVVVASLLVCSLLPLKL